MIGFLRGKIIEQFKDSIILDVNNVGYQIFIPFSRLDLTVSEISLYIKQIFRDDGVFLYGFPDLKTRNVFEEIITVQGIGPKTALQILDKYDFESMLVAVRDGRIEFFTSISGIGQKTAEKVIFELRRKLELGNPLVASDNKKSQEVVEALRGLGYNTEEAKRALSVIDDWDQPIADLVRQALKHH